MQAFYELISTDELDNLPEDDERAFVEAERICRRNVAKAVQDDGSERGDLASEMRLQYISTISALADQFGVPGINSPERINDTYLAYADFSRDVQAAVAKIVARNRKGANASSVLLSVVTKARIEQEIENLRRVISESDLPLFKKELLHVKLDELSADLRGSKRVSFGRTLAVLALVAATVGNLGGSVSGVAEGPKALANILHWIGHDKAAENAEIERLSAPPKFLPAPGQTSPDQIPTQTKSVPRWDSPKSDLDNEIPF